MLAAKAILRSQHSFHVIDPKKKLEKGITVSEATVLKIQTLLPRLISRADDAQIVWLQRFANMVKAKAVCILHRLGLMVVPHARKFTVNSEGKEYVVIAEEKLDFNPTASAQEELYHTLAKDLDPTMRQLGIFIAKTGFNDVTWRNIPILKEPANHRGPLRVGLIDLEHMEQSGNGFPGDANGSCGLIQCVSKQHIDLVIAEAKKHKVKSLIPWFADEAKKSRLAQLKSDQDLRQFYQNNGVKKGDEIISLEHVPDFPEHPNGAELKRFTEELIVEINR